MAATKRKRRGGSAVKAKRPKRNEKDARPPAKQRDMAEEAEEEERDRIPGPVCKVEGVTLGLHLRPRLRAPLLGLPTYIRLCGFRSYSGVTGAGSQLSRPDRPLRLHLTFMHVAAFLDAAC